MVRLVSFLPAGKTDISDSQAGVLTGDDKVVDLGCTMNLLLKQGAEGLAKAKAAAGKGGGVALSSVNLVAPVPESRQVFCVGLNYASHANAAGAKPPGEPMIFNKFASSICGPGTPIRLLDKIHGGMGKLDYEVEQIAVIGKVTPRAVPRDEAYNYIAGWMVGNDVSERDQQGPNYNGTLWTFGKGFDSSGVCGPFMVTSDEMPPEKAQNLPIRCLVNGKLVQDGNTSQHIFKPNDVIAHITKFITMLPGDLIYMGTPAGTIVEGAGPRGDKDRLEKCTWLKAGDVVTSECEGLGSTSNTVVGDAQVGNLVGTATAKL